MKRSKVLELANVLATKGYTQAQALRKSWYIERLKKAMKTGPIAFNYFKSDGTLRKATGTLAENLLPAVKEERQRSPLQIVYFDIEKNSFRSFRVERLCLDLQ